MSEAQILITENGPYLVSGATGGGPRGDRRLSYRVRASLSP
jgi:hypothetical protein